MQGNSYGTASRPQQPFAQGAGNTQLGVGAADEDAADEETVGGDAEAGQVPDAEDDGDDDGTAAEERTGGNTEEGVAGETA
ncbi:expressed unknown protein (Partial), partial [Seminavis robusta]|eukprot:Sro3886_g351700.1 n/a (80) ;mRNA; f:4020-4261